MEWAFFAGNKSMKKPAVILLLFIAGLAAAQDGASPPDTKTFPAEPGDRVIIQNDYGRIRVRGTSASQVTVTTRATLTPGGADHLLVDARKTGDEIFARALFGNTPGESVDFEVDVPRFVNVVVTGAAPEVSVRNIDGYVRVSSITGSISAEDLTSSVSLISERGDIAYRLRAQPTGDTRIETIHGRVGCELASNLNLRVWARAGEKLSWGDEAQARLNAFERQIGSGGPLLYVSSFQGPVRVDVSRGSANPEPVLQTPPARNPVAQPERQAAASSPIPPGKDPETNPTYKVAVDWVFLNVSVRDRVSNRNLPGLRQEDFLVYEDNVEQSVGHFETAEVPFSLLLLLDVSGSTERYLHLIKAASIDFTRQLKANDRIAVAVFNNTVRLVQDFTGDRERVARAIDGIRSGGPTTFYDALDTCIREYLRNVEGRKAIVIFSDGLDNQLDAGDGSRISFESLFADIQEIDALIYPIFLNTDIRQETSADRRPKGVPEGITGKTAFDQARERLQMIADQTGARMYSPRVVRDLWGVYSEIADDLRIQYRIGYSPTNSSHDGSWRAIRVRVRNKPDAVARTRRGYFARPGGRQ
jgi:Ca-activated chloride channel homolog